MLITVGYIIDNFLSFLQGGSQETKGQTFVIHISIGFDDRRVLTGLHSHRKRSSNVHVKV